jgi:predicted ATPase/DNA-binding SARP family transcriptional activator
VSRTVLRLLDEVSYDGRPVSGDRSQALLAVLADARGHAVVEGDLVAAVWGDDGPANPAKALQVVVSRTRAQTAADLVVRVDGGYRLGPVGTDVGDLAASVREAVRAETAGDASTARDAARRAVDTEVADGADVHGLALLRDGARRDRAVAVAVLGRTLSALGDHDEALTTLERVADPDEVTFAALLRSEAAVHGAPAALARYEAHREDVRDRLGVDPGPVLQAVHVTLLAADNPVRTGLRFDATSLLGRDDDVRRLRALVRESRVVSIVGPGGLGKTRLAHVLGREADHPVVHFVELVGVASPDDVVGEVGSALGVRDSVTGRRVLTPEQRADVRARIAAQLDQAPTLLILDNCEHVVDAVADLVATLVSTTRQVHVVTTTRAPLAISAERVLALGRLDDEAAAELFRQRALAARPDARLDDAEVLRVVARLEGLPLALELAAARVRAMSVADIDRRLDDRFALLRGSDRGLPDRHQTLVAVIDWSWNLLDERDRDALGRLALFHDGFTLDAAEVVVGPEALDVVESLVGQSLLTVRDDDGPVRYRMLEMVREFGLVRLAEAGHDVGARAVLRGWAVARCEAALVDLHGPGQVAAVRSLASEENNLAEVLRRSLGEGDAETVVVLVAALGSLWTIRGEHGRVVTLVGAVDEVLADWEPPDRLVDAAAGAASILVINSSFVDLVEPRNALALLAAYGPRSDDARVRAHAAVVPDLVTGDLSAYVDHPDGQVAMLALQWESHTRENVGDLEGAVDASLRAVSLWRPEYGPWERALHHTQLAGLYSQLGRPERAAQHAVEGLEVLDALEADDDAVQLRAVLAAGAVERGDLAEADRLVEEICARPRSGLWGGGMAVASTRAELAFARGELTAGLALYDESVVAARRMTFPGLSVAPGREPWVVYAESCALTAHARHGTGDDGRALVTAMSAKAVDVLADDERRGRRDYPVIGCLLFALGAWALLRDGDAPRAVDLLALAERFGYSRYAPSMSWEVVRGECEAVLPGALDARVASYGDRRGPDLLEEARAAVAGT